MKKSLAFVGKIAFLVCLLSCFAPIQTDAQCPMCRISAESNLKNGGTAGRGLNTGILYMFAMPYLVVGAIGFWWWKNKKNDDTNIDEQFPDDEDKARLN